MNFAFSEEQTMLGDMIRRYLSHSCGFEARNACPPKTGGTDPLLWADFADNLGILGAPLPEAAGGLGGGPVEVMIVMEALGEALVVAPYLETIVMAGGLCKRLPGTVADASLRQVIAGKSRPVPALWEPQARYAAHDIRTTARRTGDGWTIEGRKNVVIGAPGADRLIVAARTCEGWRDRSGIGLFLIDSTATGLERHDYRLIDKRPASDIVLRGVTVPAGALLGGEGDALPLIEQVIDEAIAAVCAEGVGVARRMMADTLAYAKDRKQFGQPLAGFQALQHRMVDMYMALEQAVSASYLATLKLSAPADERAKAVSAAKATIGTSLRFIGQNAVQIHGAMGMTEELAVGHYFKRATVIEQQFGDVDHHLARYAALSVPQAA